MLRVTPTTVGLDELCRLAAQEMLQVALLAERRAYLDAHADLVDETGKRLVVGNGYAKEREVTTGAGLAEVKAPRVDDRREGQHYRSVILPAYMRKSPKVTEVLPVLYLRGLSTGDFAPALGEFFGSAADLSASTVQRLTESWQAEHDQWSERDLSGPDYVYWWVDGVHFNVTCAGALPSSQLMPTSSWSLSLGWALPSSRTTFSSPVPCALRCITKALSGAETSASRSWRDPATS